MTFSVFNPANFCRVETIHCVYHFDETIESDGADFFLGYVNTFLKIKIEASGWPTRYVSLASN
jgi:hypothetical protein